MKKNLLIIICMMLSISIFAQEAKDKHLAKLPAVEIQDLNGNAFNTKDIQNDGKPVIISLWAFLEGTLISRLLLKLYVILPDFWADGAPKIVPW